MGRLIGEKWSAEGRKKTQENIDKNLRSIGNKMKNSRLVIGSMRKERTERSNICLDNGWKFPKPDKNINFDITEAR